MRDYLKEIVNAKLNRTRMPQIFKIGADLKYFKIFWCAIKSSPDELDKYLRNFFVPPSERVVQNNQIDICSKQGMPFLTSS